MIIVFLLNALAAGSAWRFATRVFPSREFSRFCLTYAVCFAALVVLSEQLLGIFHALTLPNLIIFHAVLLIALHAALRKRASVFPEGSLVRRLEFLNSSAVVLFAAAVMLAFAAVKAGINLVNPPFGWDSLNYHFTFPVEWIKSAVLRNPITVFCDPSPTYYPINGSLIYLWLLWPLKSAFLADLGQIPFYLIGSCALWDLVRRMRLSAEYAFYAVCLFFLIPNYFKQIEIAYVDVMVSALFLSSLVFLYDFHESPRTSRALIFGISAGLLVGTKTVALPYSALLILPFVFSCLRSPRKYAALGWGILMALLWGGFSYIRNFVVAGNPLYPFEVVVFGTTVFKGVMDKATYAAHFTPKDYGLMKLLFHEGLGASTLLFALPGSLGAIALALQKKRSLSLMQRYILFVPLLGFALYYFIIPLANVRYLYPFLAIGVCAGMYLWHTLGAPHKVIRVAVIVCILASIAELAEHAELAVSLILAVLLWAGLRPLIRFLKRHGAGRPAVLYRAAVGVVVFLGLAVLHAQYNEREFARYIAMQEYSGFWPDATAAWLWLNENTAGNTIAYAGRPVPYPLYGRSLKNNVFYVSVNTVEPALLHLYPGGRYRWGGSFGQMHENFLEPGNYREKADAKVWLGNLMRRRADYLFIYSLHQTETVVFPIEDDWARSRPDVFESVFENKTIRIYKVHSSPL